MNEMIDLYGTNKVAFLSINGSNQRVMTIYFRTYSYPQFAAILPNTNGDPSLIFNESPRTYETMKKWMLEIMHISMREEAKLTS